MTDLNVDSARRQTPWDPSDDDGGHLPPPPKAGVSANQQRADAAARYSAFASGTASPPSGLDCNHPGPNDYDSCINDTPAHPILFHTQSGTATPISTSDIHQHKVGDCYLVASLLALANTPQGRDVIKNAISENNDASGRVVSYTVTLHKEFSQLCPDFLNQLRGSQQVVVSAPFVRGHVSTDASDGLDEMWPAVIEKAYAQLRGGYNSVGNGGYAGDAMYALTGKSTSYFSLSSVSAEKFQGLFNQGKMLVVGTRADLPWSSVGASPGSAPSAANPYSLVPDHCYTVVGIVNQNGEPCAQLANPWGDEPDRMVPVRLLDKWCEDVWAGSLP
jgi:hypothetical protein